MEPRLRYVSTSDDVTIAYTLTGSGPALVWMPALLSNVAAQWRIPRLRDGYQRLGEHLRLVLYDGRGTGASQRDVTDLSLHATVRDLEAVADAAGFETFALLGYYQSCLSAIAYTARHPDRVTRLILFNGAIHAEDLWKAPVNSGLLTLVDQDWDLFVDSATHAWMGWRAGDAGRRVADVFRTSVTPAVARKMIEAAREMDVSDLVGSVTVPTLVLHRQDERQRPLAVSEHLAAALPNGRLLRLEGDEAALFLGDPEVDLAVLLDFLIGRSAGAPAPPSPTRSGRRRSSVASVKRADAEDGVFISCAESQKDALGRPFKALLAENGLHGYLVSDEPRPEGSWTPEEKVDAYLERSSAVVVFASADLDAGDDLYTRPNIADEIGRARSKPHLRDRVCVLKEHGVRLPSNIDPAYESLDPVHPEQAFRRALLQLSEWGFHVAPVSATPAAGTRGAGSDPPA